jgi:hypothetical protein
VGLPASDLFQTWLLALVPHTLSYSVLAKQILQSLDPKILSNILRA